MVYLMTYILSTFLISVFMEGRKEGNGLFNDINSILVFCGRQEGNVLFNDVLSTFKYIKCHY